MTELERNITLKALASQITMTETRAYVTGSVYGAHPEFTYDGASEATGQAYLWDLYTGWLLDTRCEDATMEDFRKGFLDGVAEFVKTKEN